MGIVVKSAWETRIMRQAGRIAAAVIRAMVDEVRPGVTTGKLEAVAARELAKHDATPSFKGYRGFPACICASVNEEVVHGIPGKRVLREGDLLSIDFAAVYQGFHGDTAVTVGVGKVSPEAERLLKSTRAALEAGIAAAREGSHVGDISAAIQAQVEADGFSAVREYVGHGIGRDMHERPEIPNFGSSGEGPLLKRGMTLALEPMVNAGGWRTQVRPDGWTVVTADGSLSAHFEHTIAITDGVADILTEL